MNQIHVKTQTKCKPGGVNNPNLHTKGPKGHHMESTEIYLLADGVLVKASFVNFRQIWSGAIADFMMSVFS